MYKVLFVSNDIQAVSAWKEALTSGGYLMDIALSGDEALLRAAGGTPHLIVVGALEIPQGVFLSQLKQDRESGHIPVVMLTAEETARPALVLQRVGDILNRRRVLIAEDDRTMSLLWATLLEKNGFEVRVSHDGADALREVRSWHPHLMILDIMLPVLDGFHVCQSMNEDHTIDPRPKVLIISGRGSDWDQNLGSACGAEDYMVKPVNNTRLMERVQEILFAGA